MRTRDPTNAERQRRYIGRLKSQAEINEWYEKDNARLRKRIERLKREIASIKRLGLLYLDQGDPAAIRRWIEGFR